MANTFVLRRAGLAGAIVVLLGWLMVFAAPSALAHASLQSSTPSLGQVVAPGIPVDRVVLRFDEPVEARLDAIKVIAPTGARVDTGAVSHPGGAGNQVQVGLRPRLDDGTYLVVWRVVSTDSHPVAASFSFAIGHPGAVADASAANSPASPLGPALGMTRFVGYAGLLLAVGLVTYFLLCLPAGWASPAGRRLLHGALVAAGIAAVAGLDLQAVYDVGGGWARALNPLAAEGVIRTRLGHANALRVDLLIAIWLTLRLDVRGRRPVQLLLAGELLAALTTVALEGHGANTSLTAGLDVLHLVAAGVWLGGLVALVAVDLPERRRARSVPPAAARARVAPAPAVSPPGSVAVLERTVRQHVSWRSVRRFSALAFTSVAVLVVTGVLQALRQVPEPGALTGTAYGRLLLAKIALIGLVLLAAGFSRATLRAAGCDDGRRATRLTRSVAVETLVLAVVLGVTSVLVATTPARIAYRPIERRTVNAGPVSVRLTVTPSAPRTVSVDLAAVDAHGRPAAVAGMTAKAEPSGGGLGPVTLPLVRTAAGHFAAGQVLLPRSGGWRVSLVVRTGEFDAYSSATTLTVR